MVNLTTLTRAVVLACTAHLAMAQPLTGSLLDADTPSLVPTDNSNTNSDGSNTMVDASIVSPAVAALMSTVQQLMASGVAPVPQVAPVNDAATPDAAAKLTAARQTAFQKYLISSLNMFYGNGQAAARNTQLQTLAQAYVSYVQQVPHANVRRDASDDVDPATMAVFSNVLKFTATADGKSVAATLVSSDPDYKSADDISAQDRQNECAQLQQDFKVSGQSQLSDVAKQCMCEISQSYSYCRMLLSNDLQDATASAQPTDPADADKTVPVTDSFAYADVTTNTNVPLSRRDADLSLLADSDVAADASLLGDTPKPPPGPAGSGYYNPMTGKLQGSVSIPGEGFTIKLKGDVYVPFGLGVPDASASTGDMLDLACIYTGGAKCDLVPVNRFLPGGQDYKQATTPQAGAELEICAGLPGIGDLLSKVGLGACVTVARADVFALQGPTLQISSGLKVLFMSWRLYGRIKLRNSSPVCPQDWDTNKVTSFCASAKSQNTYWQFYNNFANQDYCQMDAGSSVFGSDITMDLFLYKKTWKVFKTSPQKPRQAVQCTPIVDDASIPALYADLDCVESRLKYFADYPSVLSIPKYGNTGKDAPGARQHYLDLGKAQGNAWHGELCLAPQGTCIQAGAQYLNNNNDVAKDPQYNTPAKAQAHYTLQGRYEGRHWPGDMCMMGGSYPTIDCAKARWQYLTEYGLWNDKTATFDPYAHFNNVGQRKGLRWPGGMCVVDQLDCMAARQVYMAIYNDVAASADFGVAKYPTDFRGARMHYLQYGQNNINLWPGWMCMHGDKN